MVYKMAGLLQIVYFILLILPLIVELYVFEKTSWLNVVEIIFIYVCFWIFIPSIFPFILDIDYERTMRYFYGGAAR
jgi:hypothetical protein